MKKLILNIWECDKRRAKKIQIKPELSNWSTHTSKNTIIKTVKTTIGKYHMAKNILDNAQIREKQKTKKT